MASRSVLPLLLIHAVAAVVPPSRARPEPSRGLAGAPTLRQGWGAAFLSPPTHMLKTPIGAMRGVEGMGRGAKKGRAMEGKRSGEAVRWIGGRQGFGSEAAGRGDRVAQRMFSSQDFQVSSTHALCRHAGTLRAHGWLTCCSARPADATSRNQSMRFPITCHQGSNVVPDLAASPLQSQLHRLTSWNQISQAHGFDYGFP